MMRHLLTTLGLTLLHFLVLFSAVAASIFIAIWLKVTIGLVLSLLISSMVFVTVMFIYAGLAVHISFSGLPFARLRRNLKQKWSSL